MFAGEFMSKNKFETVSSNIDQFEIHDELLADIAKDEQLSEAWSRYHLVGDIMRGEASESIHLDLSDKIAAAIAEEPTVLAPKPSTLFTQVKAKIVYLTKPIGQVAIAASAAGLVILGVQQANVANNMDPVMQNQVVQPMPIGVADPVSYSYQQPSRASQQQAIAEQRRRIHAVLSDHKQQIKLQSQPKANDKVEQEDDTKPKAQ